MPYRQRLSSSLIKMNMVLGLCAGYNKMPITCLNVRRLPNVTQCLLDVGFTETDVAGILGGNFRRVADQIWKP
jgi:microsomal dipeptidase-like Zn-dependent dipeptidase